MAGAEQPGRAGVADQAKSGLSFIRVLTPEVRTRFVAALREGGNVRRAARAAGVGISAVYRLRKREARFAAAWDAAIAVGPRGGEPVLAADEVLRRCKGRRMQVARRKLREWSIADDERFFAELAATCNVEASAHAAGHSGPSAYGRRMRWPAFAEAWEEALQQGYARVEMRLVQVAADGPRRPHVDGGAPGPAEFDPQLALHLMRMHGAAVKSGPARRRGGLYPRREPSIEEVQEEVLRKIAAIDRARGRRGH